MKLAGSEQCARGSWKSLLIETCQPRGACFSAREHACVSLITGGTVMINQHAAFPTPQVTYMSGLVERERGGEGRGGG